MLRHKVQYKGENSMNEFFSSIGEFMKSNWQFTLIGLGSILLIGAIFNINFIIDRQGQPHGTSFLGDKAYRFLFGFGGLVLVAYGVMSLLNFDLF